MWVWPAWLEKSWRVSPPPARMVGEKLEGLTPPFPGLKTFKNDLKPSHFTQNDLVTFLERFPSFPVFLEAFFIEKHKEKQRFFENVIFFNFHVFGVPHGHFWGASWAIMAALRVILDCF